MIQDSPPFSAHNTASLPALNNRHRLRQIRGFLASSPVYVNWKYLRKLDIGAENHIGLGLGITDFTAGDLNRIIESPQNEYDVITCFEVLQHLMNMSVFLSHLHGKLRDGGRLYLSTPRLGLFAWSHGRENFAELKKRSLLKLLEYHGFRVLRYKVKRSYPFRFCFYGIRPPFKWLLHKYQLIEAQKVG